MEVLPGVAPVALLLARTDDTVVGLTDVRGYPNGFVFLLRLRWALVADRYEQLPWPFPDWGSPDPLDGDLFPEELLRFGVQFADGRRVTNMDRYPFVPEDLPADQPVLVEGGGVGSEGGRLGRGAFWDLELAVQPSLRRGRWRSCVPGRDAGSPPRGSRSTARRFGRRPTPRSPCGPTIRTAPRLMPSARAKGSI